MFILNSEVNQKLVIGHNIKVVVLDIKGDQIKIGLDVPKEMSVVRDDMLVAHPPKLRIAPKD